MSVVRSPRVALGVTALAGLTALGGVGLAMGNDGGAVNGASPMHITGVATTSSKSKPSSSSSSASSPTSPSEDEPTSPTTPPSGGDATDLYAALPPGFTKKNCHPAEDPVAGGVATLNCDAVPNGPTFGRFVQFPTQAALDNAFDDFTSEDELQPCPGMSGTPGVWSYKQNTAPDGKVACGTFQGKADLIWSENAPLMLGNISGSSVESLYDYWSGGGSNAAGRTSHT
jgi:serine/threonine-protein kinase